MSTQRTSGGSSISTLPTNAAQADKQDIGNVSLASIDLGIPAALGQAVMANSMPVVISSDQSAIQVVGNSAAAAADSGNPLKVGGVFMTTKPTYTDGQRTNFQTGARGELIVGGAASSGTTIVGNPVPIALVDAAGAIATFRGYPTNADGGAVLSSNVAGVTVANGYVFNGTSWDRQRSDGTTGGAAIGGSIAAATIDSGNPVKVGGKYNTTKPTYTDGQRGDLQIGTRGSLTVQLMTADATTALGVPATPIAVQGTTANTSALTGNAVPIALVDGTGNVANARGVSTNADGISTLSTFGSFSAVAANMLFNGSLYDRQRANSTVVVIAAGTTTTQTNISLITYNAAKLIVVVNISAGVGSLVVTINGTTSSSYVYPLLTSASIVGVGVTSLLIFPGATAVTNLAANNAVPRSVQITATVTGSVTYGIDAVLAV